MAAGRHNVSAREGRRRDAAFERLSAEVAREGLDAARLSAVAARVMNAPEVQSDAELAAMLRSCIAQREAEIRVSRAEHGARQNGMSPVAGHSAQVAPHAPSRETLELSAQRIEHEFHDHVGQFDVAEARAALRRLKELAERYAGVVDAARIERYEAELASFDARLNRFHQQVHALSEAAVSAARTGDGDRAAKALQRLSAIHAARPALLPDAEYRRIRDDMAAASDHREHREAAGLLLDREKAVAAEIMTLAHEIQRFHRVARRVAHDDPAYVEAEREYVAAVRALRAHDQEWLAALMLELADLMEAWHDTTGRAEAQVDRFLTSVRSALSHLRHEVRQIESEVHSAPGKTGT